jgi:ubiquinone/menaquinone biosynthesis C-methylase UbiE
MTDLDISSRMREDWNARAREDARYYVAFGRRDQADDDFFATAAEVVNSLEWELRRVPAPQRTGWKALEIGCGPGRLMKPMIRHFAEVHGVDVSDEMIALARQKLAGIPNVFPHATDGASLSQFADESFEYVYSYAVFQHIPNRDIVYQYLNEMHRVMKPGGLARLQFNGLPSSGYGGAEIATDTWAGARFSSSELLEFTAMHNFQVLALEGVGTQYMWTTWRKREPGWFATQQDIVPEETVRIRRITNAHSSEPVAPCLGRFASISIWVENLPPEAGLHHLRVTIGDSLGNVTYIGPADNTGLQQVTVILPELEATGLLPVELCWLGTRLAAPAVLRVIPPGPSVPRLATVTDGVNLVSDRRIETRSVKMTLEEIVRPYEIEATVGGFPAENLEYFCIDPRPQRFEVNFRLPGEVGPGRHELVVRLGRRKLAPVALEVTN